MAMNANHRWVLRLCAVEFASALSMILLSGCMVGPNYSKPAAPLNKSWVGEEKLGVERDARLDIEWWKLFQDPVLDNLVATAYRENLSLQIAAMRVLGSMAERGVAVGNLFPQSQTANGSYGRYRASENYAAEGRGASCIRTTKNARA